VEPRVARGEVPEEFGEGPLPLVRLDVQARFSGNTESAPTPDPDQFAVVRYPMPLHRDPPVLTVNQEGPISIGRQAITHDEAFVLDKIIGVLRSSPSR